MKILIILNDPPYGSEHSYNGLRLAHALRSHAADSALTVFLMGDAVLCAKAGQHPPEGFYNTERMVHRVVSSGGSVLMCGTCLDARGLTVADMIDGAARSSMDALSAAVVAADRVLVF